ncbi:MAG: hypothetical protein RL577_1425 [Bacteroidota bacterium]
MAWVRNGLLWVFLVSVLGSQVLQCQAWMGKAERRQKAYLHRIEAEEGESLWVSKSEYAQVEKGSEIWVNGKLYDVFFCEEAEEGFRVKAIRDELETWALQSFMNSQSGDNPLQDQTYTASLNPVWWDQVSVFSTPGPGEYTCALVVERVDFSKAWVEPSSPPPERV